MSSVVPGEKIPLVAHLECPEGATYYVKAEVLRPNRADITGSPKSLLNEGDGRFFDASLTMPDEPFVTVTYKVFDDALMTTESEDYCQVTETVNRAAGGSGEVIVINTPDRLITKTKDSRISTKIQDPGQSKILIQDDEATSSIQDDQSSQKTQSNQSTVRLNNG